MKNQVTLYQNAQSGSIFVLIFIAIALFAALSYVLSQGSRTGITQLTKENAKLVSAEILDQSRGLKAAIQQLRINGCTDTQISFESDADMDGNYNEVAENYNNAGAPTNYTCHVFHQKGGALSHVTNWLYQGTNPITGVGTDPGTAAGTELVAMFPITNVEDCLAINKQFDIADISAFPPHDTGGALTMFNGTYGFGAILGDEGAGLSGKQAGCFRVGAAGTTYYFYQVLIAR